MHWMHGLIEFTKGIIAHYGYAGMAVLSGLEQFLLPTPAADVALTTYPFFGMTFLKVMAVVLSATFIGACLGYFLGKYLGHPAFLWIFGQKRVDKGEQFIKKWGIWGVVVAGFTPAFKVVPWAAGIFEMPFHKFVLGVLMGRIPFYILVAFAADIFYKTHFYASTGMSAVILGVLQGITEFLPISSSGHLALAEHFLKLPIKPEEMATFDIFLHGGSLLAIIIFFWKEWVSITKEFFGSLKNHEALKGTMGIKLIIATIPAILAGLFFNDMLTVSLRGLSYIGLFFIVSAPIYFYASYEGRNNQTESISLQKSVWIGLAQAIAMVPSLSRSGMTIAIGMIAGIKREVAAKFSFMLGGVAILAANVYALVSIKNAVIPGFSFILIGFITSFLFSLLAIFLLLKYLQKHTLNAFGLYVLLLGILILTFLH